MGRQIGGFGLIEQLAAMSVAGVLSAVALPQLSTLQPLAEQAAQAHLAQAANSAMLVNFGGCLVTQHRAEPGKCRPVRDCADLGTLLHGGLPSGWRVEPQALGQGGWRANGTEGRCRLVQVDSGQAIDFSGLAAGQ